MSPFLYSRNSVRLGDPTHAIQSGWGDPAHAIQSGWGDPSHAIVSGWGDPTHAIQSSWGDPAHAVLSGWGNPIDCFIFVDPNSSLSGAAWPRPAGEALPGDLIESDAACGLCEQMNRTQFGYAQRIRPILSDLDGSCTVVCDLQ